MDRNQIIGWILIVGIVIGYITFNSSQDPQVVQNDGKEKFGQDTTQTKVNSNKVLKSLNDTISPALSRSTSYSEDPAIIAYEKEQLKSKYGVFAGSAEKKSEEIILENNKIRLHVNTNGAYVTKAVLKEYRAYKDYARGQQNELTIFEGDGNHQLINFNHSNQRQSTKSFKFTPSVENLVVNEGSGSITFSLNTDDGKGRMEYVYTLNADDYLIGFDINMIGLSKTIEGDNKGNLELEWRQKPVSIEKSLYIERQSASVFWHSQKDGYDWLNERGDDEEEAEFSTDWISFKQQFFSNILIINKDGLDKPIMKIEYNDDDTTYLKKYSALAPLKFEKSRDTYYDFDWYFGPNDFDVLADIKDGALDLEDEINFGWGIFRAVNKYVLYPIFQFILEYLGVSIGIGIILLTFAIKLLLFPITYKNYLSSAKMRVIKPHLEKLNQENKDADPVKKQQATMALYKQTGVNPLAGCIPALLQMPILIALYRLFPASIELRHQGFLWADDLSSVDDAINIGIPIPIYGDHVSIFTLLMAISMFFYMRFNQQLTPSQSGGGEMQEAIQKNMKVMMNLMPIFMLFMFNNYAAGLSFYYFLANVITIAQTITIKKFIIDEKSILAKIENQMKQPMKKSRWQKKIEEIQSKQQGKK
jgi:YidC/Oxa1 family membrane protein insertase